MKAPKVTDKYGKVHQSAADAEFANRCYEIMQYLTEDLDLVIADAERIVATLIDTSHHGVSARSKFSTFIHLTNIHLKRTPGRL